MQTAKTLKILMVGDCKSWSAVATRLSWCHPFTNPADSKELLPSMANRVLNTQIFIITSRVHKLKNGTPGRPGGQIVTITTFSCSYYFKHKITRRRRRRISISNVEAKNIKKSQGGTTQCFKNFIGGYRWRFWKMEDTMIKHTAYPRKQVAFGSSSCRAVWKYQRVNDPCDDNCRQPWHRIWTQSLRKSQQCNKPWVCLFLALSLSRRIHLQFRLLDSCRRPMGNTSTPWHCLRQGTTSWNLLTVLLFAQESKD